MFRLFSGPLIPPPLVAFMSIAADTDCARRAALPPIAQLDRLGHSKGYHALASKLSPPTALGMLARPRT